MFDHEDADAAVVQDGRQVRVADKTAVGANRLVDINTVENDAFAFFRRQQTHLHFAAVVQGDAGEGAGTGEGLLAWHRFGF